MTKMNEITLNIQGMHCASCVHSVERGVSKLPGVSSCRVNLSTRSAVVAYDKNRLEEQSIIERIDELGYRAEAGGADLIESGRREQAQARQDFAIALFMTLPLIVTGMGSMVIGGPFVSARVDGIIQAVTASLVLFYAGRSILVDAFKQTYRLTSNMNSLIALGTLTAWGWSLFALWHILNGREEALYFESAGMIITLILLGRYLETRSRGRATQEIDALLRLRPKQATAIIEGAEVEIEAAAVQPGMVLLVRPGERIAADGVVQEGKPFVDQSILTGESVPVEKSEGDRVTGGAINGQRPFKMTVTAAGEASFVAHVVRLVTEAQSRKAPVQKIADRVASVFVPVVLGIAGVTLAAWLLLAPDSPLVVRSVVAVLIVACPCALGLATPTAVLAGTGRAAREGIIIRGGDILERLSKVDTCVFDKTGTLTHGELEVVRVQTFGQYSEQNVVKIVAAIEQLSEHPVGAAIVRYRNQQQLGEMSVKNVQARPGFGMIGDIDGRRLLVGNRALMDAEGVSFGQSLRVGEQEMERGRSVVFAAIEGQVIGLVSLADRLRSEARDVIAALKRMTGNVTMISGDYRRTAEGVARTLELDSFEAEIKPEQKQAIVESYRKAGYTVAMVGDGVNDAPGLAAADVGIAVGSGTDVAIEVADVVLVSSDLAQLPRLFEISKLSLKVIKQNLFWAFFYNSLAIPVAAGLFFPWFGWTLSPVIAALAMSLSSVFVVQNSLRIGRLSLS